ncbi:DNA-binding transcriptional regulator, LysR family [Salegentibacter holothuriorum]|uniref:DNA-binding transcriptional regulator, LysR family n=1 Tax=Salegentibacter holothuriorum TaxID=241145 RepID=A0A1T5A514_9FLAO|nr:LysR substrate-binding domain-containing protein [Salegentibacter holothuriorum]SKB30050.1 DNA-binding transcriptional regulator, LysR family [Salegentibacter holothuriorum]
MTLQQIQYFLKLAQELHFWQTSEKLNISQSSLSRQIKSLEDEIGIKLFERNKRNVALTEAGIFLEKHWGGIIDEFNRIQRQAKKIDEGTSGAISIAYPGSIAFKYLPDLLKKIDSNLPDLKIELTEPTDQNHEKLLLNYQIDISFSRDRILNYGITSLKLYTEPIFLVVPNNHWTTSCSTINFKDLENEKFIISGLNHTTFFASTLRNIFHKHGFEPKQTLESDFGGMILTLVSREMGISILPYSFKFAKSENVTFIDIKENIDLFINWRKKDRNSVIEKVVTYSKIIGKEFY